MPHEESFEFAPGPPRPATPSGGGTLQRWFLLGLVLFLALGYSVIDNVWDNWLPFVSIVTVMALLSLVIGIRLHDFGIGMALAFGILLLGVLLIFLAIMFPAREPFLGP
ncbi:MAG: hypothetical protein AB7K24_17735 [Gemmataceae bacterium]